MNNSDPTGLGKHLIVILVREPMGLTIGKISINIVLLILPCPQSLEQM